MAVPAASRPTKKASMSPADGFTPGSASPS
jgi:hypothetical protein